MTGPRFDSTAHYRVLATLADETRTTAEIARAVDLEPEDPVLRAVLAELEREGRIERTEAGPEGTQGWRRVTMVSRAAVNGRDTRDRGGGDVAPKDEEKRARVLALVDKQGRVSAGDLIAAGIVEEPQAAYRLVRAMVEERTLKALGRGTWGRPGRAAAESRRDAAPVPSAGPAPRAPLSPSGTLVHDLRSPAVPGPLAATSAIEALLLASVEERYGAAIAGLVRLLHGQPSALVQQVAEYAEFLASRTPARAG